MNKKQIIGSMTAKGGFANELDISLKFNNFKFDIDAQEWLEIMGYNWHKITNLVSLMIPPRISKKTAIELGVNEDRITEAIKYKKSDIQIRILIVMNDIHYIENISLKKCNSNVGFNQIDKRSVETYQAMWGFNNSIANTLKLFTGAISPIVPKSQLRDTRRMYLTEIDIIKVDELVSFLNINKTLICMDILKGRGAFSADWIFVTQFNIEDEKLEWVIKDINFVCNFYASGDVIITQNGNLKLGRVSIQRKGGTPDPTSLQFKINPLELMKAKLV
jgi:hypothetical protein